MIPMGAIAIFLGVPVMFWAVNQWRQMLTNHWPSVERQFDDEQRKALGDIAKRYRYQIKE